MAGLKCVLRGARAGVPAVFSSFTVANSYALLYPFAGCEFTVSDVFEYLASGMSVEEILADFPDLTAEDIRACLAFAADRDRKLLSIPAASDCCSIKTFPVNW